jgi:hypothetical protein
MGTYATDIPPGQPKAQWLISRGAVPVTPPASLAGIPEGRTLIAVVTANGGFDAALIVATAADLADATATTRPVTWLLMDETAHRTAPQAAALSAGTLAGLLRDAGLPCVTLTATEAAAAAIPATPAEEGLRVVDGTMPVRLAYPIPPAGDAGHHAALRRRDSHVLWLYDWAEQHRWSADRAANDEWITISPEPRPATYMLDGREVARCNGRPVDDDLGSWVVFWIVEDADAWADAIEAEVAAEIARAPKNRRFATAMQQQRIGGAAEIRAAGPRPRHPACRDCGEGLSKDQFGWHVEYDAGPAFLGRQYQCAKTRMPHVLQDLAPHRTVRSTEYSRERADAHVAGLWMGCPNPGVRYEAAPVTATAACLTCFCPMIEAGGQWWHHTGGYPAQCPGRRPARDLPAEPGEWEFSGGVMTCGYCGMSVHWKEVDLSWVQLTGAWMLAVQLEVPDTGPGSDGRRGDLVVLAETEGIARRPGQRDVLPHHCENIPDEVRAEYASEIEAITTRTEPQ